MTKVIIIGHGNYGSMMHKSLTILVGENKDIYYLDFLGTEEVTEVEEDIKDIITPLKDDILIVCDLVGGTPYRVSCLVALEEIRVNVIAGINVASLCELTYNLNLSSLELATLAQEVTLQTVIIFNK